LLEHAVAFPAQLCLDNNHFRGVRNRQGPQEQVFGHTEDGTVGSNSQSQ
jgi:hypothetical protein